MSDIKYIHDETHKLLNTERWKGERKRERKKMCGCVMCICF